MASYRIYMISNVGKRDRPTDANCDTDEDAMALAQRVIVKPNATAEVWRGDNLVAVVSPVSAMEITGFASPWGSPKAGS